MSVAAIREWYEMSTEPVTEADYRRVIGELLSFIDAVASRHPSLPSVLRDTAIAALASELRAEIFQLRAWAVQNEAGGYSTHQNRPMKERAERLSRVLREFPGDFAISYALRDVAKLIQGSEGYPIPAEAIERALGDFLPTLP